MSKTFSVGKGLLNWFPGHMTKATREIEKKLSSIDVVLEVRDARIPFSSKNPVLEGIVASRKKTHVIILNKADLANHNLQQKVIDCLQKEEKLAIFTSSVSKSKNTKIDNLIPMAVKAFQDKKVSTQNVVKMMIFGVPNVGKSTIINHLKLSHGHSKNVARTGPQPGVTRHITSFKVSSSPVVYLTDTPGVMLPRIDDQSVGLKLAITGAIKDSRVGTTTLADYLLHTLNELNHMDYLKKFNLSQPEEDIYTFLQHVAEVRGLAKLSSREDMTLNEAAAALFVQMFRKGELGRFTLDDVP